MSLSINLTDLWDQTHVLGVVSTMLYHLSHRTCEDLHSDCSLGLCIVCHVVHVSFKRRARQELCLQRGAVVEPWLSQPEVYGSSPGKADVYFVRFVIVCQFRKTNTPGDLLLVCRLSGLVLERR